MAASDLLFWSGSSSPMGTRCRQSIRGDIISADSCCCGLIVEGVPASGKTTLIRHLRGSHQLSRLPQRSMFIVGEELTQRVLEPAYNRGELECADHLRHMQSILQPLVEFSSLLAARGWQNQRRHHYVYLLERFHLTHATYYPYMSWDDIDPIDALLHRLGSRLLVLTTNERTLGERLFAGRDSDWFRYISRYGDTQQEIVEHYQRRQHALLAAARRSRLAVREIDTSSVKPTEVADEVMKFWLG